MESLLSLSQSMKEEYLLAKQENRQPRCIYCGKPLEIAQTQSQYIYWHWDDNTKSYCKDDSDGDAETPFCVKCEARDWDFIDSNFVSF